MINTDYSDRNPKMRIEKMDELFILLTQIMNKVHHVNYSERFWRILLQDYISSSLSRYADFNKKKILYDTILPTGAKKISIKRKVFAYLKYFILVIKTRNNHAKINAILSHQNNICISALFGSDLPQGVQEILPDYYYYPIIPRINFKKRKSLKIISKQIDDLYLRNIILSVPKIFVEYFDLISDKVLLTNPEEKIIHTTIFTNTFNRYLVANYTENGAKLYGYQHGASYGEERYHPSYIYEYSIADRFHTWGWKINQNDTPYHAFRIQKFIAQYKGCKINDKYDCLLIFGRFLSWNKDQYWEKGLHFANTIDRKKYPHIVARPRKENKKSDAKVDLLFLEKFNFVLDDGNRNNTPMLIKRSNIVIILYYPTTLAFECLSVDHPLVCLNENKDSSDFAMEHYKNMYDLNIFHEGINSLVEFLNHIDINEWWAAIIKDKRYIAFKNSFLKEKL